MLLRFYVDTVEVGTARLACVPHVGEEVQLALKLAPIPENMPVPGRAHFRVDRVVYQCRLGHTAFSTDSPRLLAAYAAARQVKFNGPA